MTHTAQHATAPRTETVRPAAPQDGADRFYSLDAGRAILMLLGVPYHVANFLLEVPASAAPGDFQLALLYEFVAFVHSFRMPAFFIIAGFFAALILARRDPVLWLRGRLVRLGVPLVTGLLLFSPLEIWLHHMVTGEPDGVAAFFGAWLSYLWFLPVLMIFSATLAAIWSTVFAPGARVRAQLVAHPEYLGLPVVVFGIAIGCWTTALYAARLLGLGELYYAAGFLDVHKVLEFAPWFLLGVLAAIDRSLFDRLTRTSGPALLTLAIAIVVYELTWEQNSRLEIIASSIAGALAALLLSQALLAVLRRWLDRPSAHVRFLVDASFTVYLVHYPVVTGCIIALASFAFPPLIDWLLGSVITIAVCLIVHVAAMRSRPLRLALNGTMPSPATKLAQHAGNVPVNSPNV